MITTIELLEAMAYFEEQCGILLTMDKLSARAAREVLEEIQTECHRLLTAAGHTTEEDDDDVP